MCQALLFINLLILDNSPTPGPLPPHPWIDAVKKALNPWLKCINSPASSNPSGGWGLGFQLTDWGIRKIICIRIFYLISFSLSGFLTTAITWCPSSRALLTACIPVGPVAPNIAKLSDVFVLESAILNTLCNEPHKLLKFYSCELMYVWYTRIYNYIPIHLI